MSGLPAEMTDRWRDRAEPAPGEGLIYWHMLVGLDPDILALATDVTKRLARLPGLHMTPLAWLHMTVLIAGAAREISADRIQEMAAVASRLLASVPPVTVTIGKILYRPEAITLAARPAEALLPVLEAAREATREVTGSDGPAGSNLPWTPHITVAYSTAECDHQSLVDAIASGRITAERDL